MSRLLSISQANTHTHTGCVSQGPLGPCHRTCWALRKPAVSSHVHRTLYVSVCVSLEVRGDDVQGREGRKDRERENANESRFSWKLHESVVEKVEEAETKTAFVDNKIHTIKCEHFRFESTNGNKWYEENMKEDMCACVCCAVHL